ncbi:MAG: GNAT family N-acetyltransferase, partial [Staphylococcus xylosus]
MVIKQNFENIIVQVFEEKYRQALYDFNLNERQQIYSSLPKDVLDDAINDEDRIANIALNEAGDVIGFFVLH